MAAWVPSLVSRKADMAVRARDSWTRMPAFVYIHWLDSPYPWLCQAWSAKRMLKETADMFCLTPFPLHTVVLSTSSQAVVFSSFVPSRPSAVSSGSPYTVKEDRVHRVSTGKSGLGPGTENSCSSEYCTVFKGIPNLPTRCQQCSL